MIDGDQAYLLARSVENWAMVLLDRDARQGKSDTLSENWALPLVPTTVEGGMVAGALEDLQSRFNINNLVIGTPEQRGFSLQQFRRLLMLCKLETGLAETVADWLDEDSDSRISAGGTEDDIYWQKDTMCRSANRPMTSVSELSLIPGFDAEALACLKPAVAALPTATEINVNTAGALVVASLSSAISLEDAETLVENRGRRGFKDVADFLAQPALAASGLSEKYLGVGSSYFMASAQATVGRGDCTLYSLLNRGNNRARVLGRSIGTY